MNMDQKNKTIEQYIINVSNQINSQYDGLVDDDKISRAIEMFRDSSDDLETEIIPKINKLAQEIIDNYIEMKEKNQRELMLKNIDKNINSDFFIEMLKKDWEKNHSINSLGNLIGELYIHHIINKDGYGFEYYMTEIEKLHSEYSERKISPENFELDRAKLISTVIASKLGFDIKKVTPENLLKVKNYFLQEYVTNGYVSHSFPDAYYESIMKNGLISSTESRQDKPIEIQEIQDIFMNKGVVSPMGAYPFYGGSGIYYEHDFTKMFKHAVDSPEWFNWFTSADHTTTYHDGVEKSPYILRNEGACRRNVDDLCLNAELNQNDTKKVIEFYIKHYNKFSSPKLNVAMISKRTVGKNIISNVVPQDMDFLSTIIHVLNDNSRQYVEHSGNVYLGTLSPNKLGISVIPNVSKYITPSDYQRETKEHLTDPDNNLVVLQTVDKNKSRLIPSMIPKVEKVKEMILNKKKQTNQQTELKKISNSTSSESQISSKNTSFDKRSQNEIQVYNQIKQKNRIIKKHKEQNKAKAKILTAPSAQGLIQNNSKGFVNTIILLISLGIIAIVLTLYILIRR